MKDCIFCKIIQGDIPSTIIYEDQHVLAFLDIMPIVKGHTLVVPKQHEEFVTNAPADMMQELGVTLQKVSKAVQKACGSNGISILLSNGESAGQVIPHIHFHIVPRNTGDGLHFDAERGKYAAGELEEYQKKIVSAV